MSRVSESIESKDPRAVYIGASNDDDPQFYEIFLGAMEIAGIKKCRMIPSTLTEDDKNFLMSADLILLAGGNAVSGWRKFETSGVRELIVEKYLDGAILMGVSAGAMQLGLYAWPDEEPTAESLTSTFGLVPFIISAHDEKQGWEQLRKVLVLANSNLPGIGIPTGGGMIYHTDHAIEPVRVALQEFSLDDGKITAKLLLPGPDEEIQELSTVN